LTEKEEAILKLGVEVDFSLTETRGPTDHHEKLISAPGCPLYANHEQDE